MTKITFQQAREFSPPGFRRYLVPQSQQTHPSITHRREFSPKELLVFSAMVDEIRRANPDQFGLRCWAVGSRVTGRWKTKEQAEMLAAQGFPLKYSDWDVATNAKKLPSRHDILRALSQYGEAGHVIAYKKKPKTAVPLDVPPVFSSAALGSAVARICRLLPMNKEGD